MSEIIVRTCSHVKTQDSKEEPCGIVLLKDENVKAVVGCTVILKSGERVGEPCGRINCYYHKINMGKINMDIDVVKCTVILKSGKRVGMPCGRVNCGIHKKHVETQTDCGIHKKHVETQTDSVIHETPKVEITTQS